MGYILSFGLVRLRTVRILIQVFTLAAEDVTITNVIIKTPERKWDWGMNDVRPGSDGLGILVIFEKKQLVEIGLWARLVEIWRWTRIVAIRTWARPVELWTTGCAARLLGQLVEILTLDREFSWGVDCWRCRNSQHSKNCVSLSPRVGKLKKLINVSCLN